MNNQAEKTDKMERIEEFEIVRKTRGRRQARLKLQDKSWKIFKVPLER